jgi:hypothetical protein
MMALLVRFSPVFGTGCVVEIGDRYLRVMHAGKEVFKAKAPYECGYLENLTWMQDGMDLILCHPRWEPHYLRCLDWEPFEFEFKPVELIQGTV